MDGRSEQSGRHYISPRSHCTKDFYHCNFILMKKVNEVGHSTAQEDNT